MARPGTDDATFANDLRSAVTVGPRLSAHLLLLAVAAFVIAGVVWASQAVIDEVTSARGRVIPSSKVQVVQNLEGGVVAAINAREGQLVQQDQVLLVIDDTQASSKLRVDQAQVMALSATIARLEAEQGDGPPQFAEDAARERPDLVASETELLAARRAELESALAVLRRQREQRQRELAELQASRERLQGNLAKVREELQILEPLVAQGVSSRIELIRLQRQENDIAGQIAAAEQAIPGARAALAETGSRIDEHRAEARTEVARELARTRAELASIQEALAAGEDRVRRTEVRAPVTGTVKQLLINTVGGVVKPGADLVEIVPLEDNLLIEAQVRPADIAFLHPGQDANVRFTAYDYTVYGSLAGLVEQIGADSIVDAEGQSYYRVLVRTTRNFIVGPGGKTLPIIPGMVAEIDILTGKRTVLDYLLKPLNKARMRAFRER